MANLFDFIHNAALLGLGAVIIGLFDGAFRRNEIVRAIGLGVLFGGIGVVAMHDPIRISGLIFDARGAVLALAMVFGGVPAGVIAMAIIATARIEIGGPGLVAGLVGIGGAATVGFVFRIWLTRHGSMPAIRPILLLAIATPPTVAIGALFLPSSLLASGDVQMAVLLSNLINGFAIVFMGLILLRDQERRRALQAIEENEATLRAISLHAPGILFRRIVASDGSSRLEGGLEGLERLLGLDPGTLQRDPAAMLAGLPEEDRTAHDATLATAASTGTRWSFKGRFRRPDGSAVWLRQEASPRPGPRGETIWEGFAIDISESVALASAAETEKRDAMAALSDRFEHGVRRSIDSLARLAEDMRAASAQMADTAGAAADLSRNAAHQTTETSAEIGRMASVTEALEETVGAITHQTLTVSEKATETTELVRATRHDVAALADASSRIGTVTNFIQSIAAQTNLLALNATIEAARAGVAGKGFAVVANEVKVLAMQTAAASAEIAEKIATIQRSSAATAEAMGQVESVADEMRHIAAIVADAASENVTSIATICASARQSVDGASRLNRDILTVDRTVGETGHAANRVLASARVVGEQTDDLLRRVDDFVRTIRAGV